jgi:hypothetical protein
MQDKKPLVLIVIGLAIAGWFVYLGIGNLWPVLSKLGGG